MPEKNKLVVVAEEKIYIKVSSGRKNDKLVVTVVVAENKYKLVVVVAENRYKSVEAENIVRQ